MEKYQMEKFIINQNSALAYAMQKIDDNSNGTLFVTDDRDRLCGAVSDGDIRRWILREGTIDAAIDSVMNRDPKYLLEDEKDRAADRIEKYDIKAIPVVDKDKRVIDIILSRKESNWNIVDNKALKNVPVVIMAGGKGTRLYPYTKILPKPLIPIGEIPIVERVMDSFRNYGAERFFLTVNYKKNMIESYFADNPKNYCIEYIEEDIPLGTGGSLRLIREKFEAPFVVTNCDSLIRTDYSRLYKHHKESKNEITIVTSVKNDIIPYGVIYSKENGELDYMVEKPTRSYLINTGMYVINPEIVQLIPKGKLFHMTHLVEEAKERGYRVGMYPVSEDSFLDMGEFAEMKRMEEKLNI